MPLAALLLLAALAPAPDNAAGIEDAEAYGHFVKGMTAWRDEDFGAAKREFEIAYAIDPAPKLLYSLGRVALLMGECNAAHERFEAYLRTGPSPEGIEDTRVNMAQCEPTIAEVPDLLPADPDPPPGDEPAIPDPLPPADTQHRPDALGISLTVVGAAITTVGFGLFGSSFAQVGRAEDERTIDGFDSGLQRARTQYFTGIGLASAGAAMLVGGIVRLVIVRQRRRSNRHAAR